MGMTIDEAIATIKDEKWICCQEKYIEALNLMENIMCKYQKIEDILEHHKGDEVECVICAPTVEAIPKADYEARLKADMVAMLTDIQLEIEEMDSREHECDFATQWCIDRDIVVEIIQQKIDKMKEVEK